MKSIYKYLFFIGLSMFVLSIIMFFTSVGLFTARGGYSEIIVKLGEISFLLWYPFLIMGIFLTILGIGIYFSKTSK
ncbi:hypothetical protein J2795_000814 [Chryseobacterium bernardetii]|uniref:Uncharacterized protein n=3 Tax=Chryseobacterium TaxID=59732 RepID=A0A543EM17_9FLAO|nr:MULTISPECIES: hypothetical protein [Chryseobacterium]MDR6368948.1 hypothetical protein [Chryseobacterium vietnamense]MDR6440129.1 hypothetical protein [Chryseobacterium bernardetii]MDR6459725.1 hypothetical protein [Chryseobacterium vietnamense]TQM22559.1 hypothetical protein FB551_2272 [Chryseobacterium aquifrigidense]